jgi:hypothetical protein
MDLRPQKTSTLRLTRYEVLHLRDLFSILLPTEARQTVSQALAAVEDRSMVEARLWQKVLAACREVGLPVGDEAPDFVAAAASSPPVGVFRLATDPTPAPDAPGRAKALFEGGEQE